MVKLIFAIVLFLFNPAIPAEARKVAVGVPVLDVTQSALYVARDRGYYQKEGLEVDLILMRGGVANQALIAGNVEFTTVPTAGLQAALQGAPLKVVLSTFHKPMFWLYSRPEIRNIKDLSGKKVAVSSLGAAGDSALRELIKKNGMDENREVAILAIGTTATRLGALSSRRGRCRNDDVSAQYHRRRVGLSRAGLVHRIGYHSTPRSHRDARRIARIRSGRRGKISPRDD